MFRTWEDRWEKAGFLPLFLIEACFTRPYICLSIPQSSAEGLREWHHPWC